MMSMEQGQIKFSQMLPPEGMSIYPHNHASESFQFKLENSWTEGKHEAWKKQV